MNMKDSILLMENSHTELPIDDINQAFNLPGIGELIEIEFESAVEPGDAISGLVNMFNHIETSIKSGNSSVARDEYQINDFGTIRLFKQFIDKVSRDPDSYYMAYTQH